MASTSGAERRTRELSPDVRAFLLALAAGPLAWRRPGELVIELGLPYDQVEERLARLEADGLVERWWIPWQRETPWILSSLAAEALDLALCEEGSAELPRWYRPRDETPPTTRQPRNLPQRDLFALCGLIPPPPSRPARRLTKRRAKKAGRFANHPGAGESPPARI
jgi:DNA-binding transcriptional ArsR family regulator